MGAVDFDRLEAHLKRRAGEWRLAAAAQPQEDLHATLRLSARADECESLLEWIRQNMAPRG